MATGHLRLLIAAAGVAGLFVLADAPLAGQEAALPKPADIVAKYVAALGGEAAHKAISSIHATGTCEIPAQNLSGPIDLYSARPAKMLLRVDIPGIGRIESGYDGKVGWELSPVSGPSVVTGRRLTEMADDSWFDSLFHAPERVKAMTTVAKTTFDQRSAYQVKVEYVSGSEVVEYYDIETGLLIGSEATRETPMGVLPTVGLLHDYRKFGAMLEATSMSTKVMGFEQVLHLATFEYDKVPAGTFDLPPVIKTLIAK